ncbi:MAG: hypothetical protein Q9180_009926, partial [Flavoplaca navasiana]
MGPPPAKRRRKVVVLSSEDEEDEPAEGKGGATGGTSLQNQATQNHKIQVLPTRLRSRTKPVTKAPPIAPVLSTNQPLPKKSAPRHNNDGRKEPRPSSLDTYFSAASNVHVVKSASSQNPQVAEAVEEEDFIEDDS